MALIQEIYVPKETVNDEFVTVSKLYFKSGDKVKKGDIVADLETSKTIISIEAEADGYLEVFCKEGEDVEINTLLMSINDSKNIIKEDIQKENLKDSSVEEILFSKNALALIKEHNIPKAKFIDRDFVNKDDVLEILNKSKEKKSLQKSNTSNKNLKSENDNSLVEIKPISGNKKIEIEYLSDVQSGLMNSTLNVAVDVKNIDKSIVDNFKFFKDSYLPIIVYEVSRLLQKYKEFNAYFMGDSIGYYKDVNVGVAVDIDDGLKVLTLPNSNKLDMSRLESKLYTLIEKYLDKSLEVSDITGSTFTITDLSSYGIDFFTPLINTKQSAILGVSKVDKKLNRFYLTLVFDHRVTEGKRASEFLVELKNRIESYNLIEDSADEKAIKDIKCSICFKTLKEDKYMQGFGLIKIVNHKGKEDYICNVCLAGY